MAYPIPPAPRLAYDRDGTQVFFRNAAGVLTEFVPEARQWLNATTQRGAFIGDWGRRNVVAAGAYLLFIFPVPMTIAGIFWVGRSEEVSTSYFNVGVMRMETSRNSTSGDDGDWLSGGTVSEGFGTGDPTAAIIGEARDYNTGAIFNRRQHQLVPTYRQSYSEDGKGWVPLSGGTFRRVRAIRFFDGDWDAASNGHSGTFVIHLYGRPDSSASEERYLSLYKTAATLPLTADDLGWGDVLLGTTNEKTFRIYNESHSYTAVGITVGIEDMMGYPEPSPAGSMMFSVDGANFYPTLGITGLGPLSFSPTITVRRITPLAAPLSVWAPRITYDVDEWVSA